MRKLFFLMIIAAIAFIFSSCDKEKNKEESLGNSKVVTINMEKLHVYYNGVEMNCLMEDFKKPVTRNADMEEVTIVSVMEIAQFIKYIEQSPFINKKIKYI
jgi:hypothetical protein